MLHTDCTSLNKPCFRGSPDSTAKTWTPPYTVLSICPQYCKGAGSEGNKVPSAYVHQPANTPHTEHVHCIPVISYSIKVLITVGTDYNHAGIVG